MRSTVYEWLDKNNLYYDKVVFTHEGKKQRCRELNIDIMIEDKASNVEKISDVIPVLCFDAPYNLSVNKDNVTRVYSWYQIYKYFLDLEKEKSN